MKLVTTTATVNPCPSCGVYAAKIFANQPATITHESWCAIACEVRTRQERGAKDSACSEESASKSLNLLPGRKNLPTGLEPGYPPT